MASPTQTDFRVQEPISGYQTSQLIGRGGYGEVWSAAAPGGLAKAIKIVYGDPHSERVASELRALNRVKDIRHPFLLSLERVELVSGNLVLVTELADRNLKDCFQLHRNQELTGIPQAQLLAFCRDVADALDYMYTECSLQHLDVKPENILLVGNRAKLGDYGLVKHLYERSCSLVGGLTPTYSPPELFEGKPTRYSDQYSLAIVYMEMLTGALPFLASNTAQLAAQHLKSVPDLNCLPQRQRPIIARALSKGPSQRYESCRALVDALCAAAEETETPPTTGSKNQAEHRDDPQQSARQPDATHYQRRRTDSEYVPAGAEKGTKPTIAAQGLCETTACGTGAAAIPAFGPIVVIGLGNTGGKVVHKFLARVADRVGPLSEFSWLQALILDTDARRLNALLEDRALMKDVQTVPIPLQRPETCAGQADSLLDWLDRRWFYNIPRNLSTGGCRALARLALVLNATRVADALSRSITKAIESTAARHVCERVGLPFVREHCQVILVGSVSGGTSGGTILDLAYAARTELKRHQLNRASVEAILLHSTPQGKIGRDKAITNACATLRELNHYSMPGRWYPGEPSLGVPPFHGDNAPFQAAYFAHLGEHCSNIEWQNGIDRMAEALYCWTLTAARKHIDDARAGSEVPRADGTLQTVHVVPLGTGTDEIIAQAVTQACVDVVRRWRDGCDAACDRSRDAVTQRTALVESISQIRAKQLVSERSDDDVKPQLQRMGITNEELVRSCYQIVALELGTDPSSCAAGVSSIVDEALAGFGKDQPADGGSVGSIIDVLDHLLQGLPDESQADAPDPNSLYERLVARLSVRENRETRALIEWISNLVDAPNDRIGGARHAATVAVELLQEMQARIQDQANQCHQKSLQVAVCLRDADDDRFGATPRQRWLGKRQDTAGALRKLFIEYAQLCVHKTVLDAVWKQLRLIEGEIGVLIERLNEVSRDLTQLCDKIGKSRGSHGLCVDDRPTVPGANRYYRVLMESLLSARNELARKVELEMDKHLLGQGSGLKRFITDRGDVGLELGGLLQMTARNTVLHQVGALNRRLLSGGDAAPKARCNVNLAEILAQLIAEGKSQTQEGDSRDHHVVIVPDGVDISVFEARTRSSVGDAAVCAARTDEIAVCRVRTGETAEKIAHRISHGVRAFDELAGRVLTRTDVKWDPIGSHEVDLMPVSVEPGASLEGAGNTCAVADLERK